MEINAKLAHKSVEIVKYATKQELNAPNVATRWDLMIMDSVSIAMMAGLLTLKKVLVNAISI